MKVEVESLKIVVDEQYKVSGLISNQKKYVLIDMCVHFGKQAQPKSDLLLLWLVSAEVQMMKITLLVYVGSK